MTLMQGGKNEVASRSSEKLSLTLASEVRDGFEVTSAALEHNLDLTLLPRQVLLVGTGDKVVGCGAFVHGVPQGSTIAAATIAQDKRVRRALLQRRGFRVPPGATFSIGRSAGSARRFAETIGYPVVVKPALGDNTIGTLPSLSDKNALIQAVEYLHTPVDEREGYTRAAYAMTELREVGSRDGHLVAPDSYRFLVEKQVSGEYLRVLVLNGEVISVVLCPHGGQQSKHSGAEEVLETVHASILKTAKAAAEAIPGLPLVALDLIVDDIESEKRIDEINIVEYSERPWLAVQGSVSEELAATIGRTILLESVKSARASRTSAVSVEVRLAGAVNPIGLRDTVAEEASSLGLECKVQRLDQLTGDVIVRLTGPSRNVAWLLEQILGEGIGQHRAMLADAKHV